MAGRNRSGEWLFWFSLIAAAAIHAQLAYLAFAYAPEKHGAIARQTTAISISLEASDILEAAAESDAAQEAAAGIPAEAAEKLTDRVVTVEQPEPAAGDAEPETEIADAEPELLPVEKKPETALAEPVPVTESLEQPRDRTLEQAEAALERAMHAEMKRREEAERQAKVEREAHERREKQAREQKQAEQHEKQRTARSAPSGAGGIGKTNSTSGRVSASTGSIKSYRLLIQSKLAREWPTSDYPGKVVIVMSLTTSGNLKSVRLITSSGYKKLDREMLSAVRRAAPFPRPPAGMSLSQLSNMAVEFKVR